MDETGRAVGARLGALEAAERALESRAAETQTQLARERNQARPRAELDGLSIISRPRALPDRQGPRCLSGPDARPCTGLGVLILHVAGLGLCAR